MSEMHLVGLEMRDREATVEERQWLDKCEQILNAELERALLELMVYGRTEITHG